MLLTAARESFPHFRRYLQAKARLLGHEKLPWYDLFAPVGEARQGWSFGRAGGKTEPRPRRTIPARPREGDHWNEDDPAEVPASCAKCHSAAGYQDFLGADGSAAGTIEAVLPAKGNPGITCTACHNAVTLTKTSVVFPSGIEIKNLGDDSRCMECHQGRESKVSVDEQIAQFKAETALDTVVAPIKDDQGKDVKFGFRNIHYFAAAATLYGTEVKGGYEYDGKAYDAKNDHVPGRDTCTGCHEPHNPGPTGYAAEVRTAWASSAHGNVAGAAWVPSSSHKWIASGGSEDFSQMAIQGIRYNICFAANEPLEEWFLGIVQHSVPLPEPLEFCSLGLPERGRIAPRRVGQEVPR